MEEIGVRRSGPMVGELDSDRAVRARALAGTLRCVLRQDTFSLSASRHPGV